MFQAKKNWEGANRQLLEQAEHMAAYGPSAVVVAIETLGSAALQSWT